MVAVPVNLFQAYPDVRLRVWFNDGTHGWQRLSPDQRLVSVGYAMMAQNAVAAESAQTVPDGSITTAKLANSSITADKMTLNSITSIALANNSVTLGKIADGAVTADKLASGSIIASKLAGDSVSSSNIANGSINTEDLADGSVTSIKIATGAIQSTNLAPSSVIGSKIAASSITGTHISDNSVSPSKLTNGSMNSYITFAPQGFTTPFAVSHTGLVANLNADMLDGLSSADFMRPTGTTSLALNSPAILDFGSVTRQNINLWGAGSYGIGVQADTLYQRSASGFAWFKDGTHNNAAGNPGAGGTKMMSIDGQGVLRLEAPQGRLETPVLTITGGADLAESFDVSDDHLLEPGEVLVIDDSRPGWLKRSNQAYDTRVAGIVSGAGGVRPGLTLSQKDVMEGSHLVALTGRVYVKADHSEGAIRPGDLLTTSSRPGYACRASDRERSPGAIIGKAMSALEEKEGLVLVLVSLH
jgi:hypothetical protein